MTILLEKNTLYASQGDPLNERSDLNKILSKSDSKQAKPDIIRQLVEMRHRKGMTQSQVAIQMGTTASAVARLESGGGKKRHSPSLRTLKLYAEAIGYNIAMMLIAL
jgi:DNA-binding XRE family transcriptional regulator